MKSKFGRSKIPPRLPKARKENLVVRELADELLIYDLQRYKAYCLNQTAALVWRSCDGERSIASIVQRMEQELKAPVDPDVVSLALYRLEKARLLAEETGGPPRTPGLSRRDLIRRLGLASAIALPLVTSVVAPTAVHAQTALPKGACLKLPVPQCLPFPCIDTNGKVGNCSVEGIGPPNMSCQCVS